MSTLSLSLTARALALSASMLFFLPAWSADVGQIKVATGSVHIERAGQRIAAFVGAGIQQSDTLVTGPDGAVGITFTDTSLVSAGPNSVLAVDRYAFDSTTHVGVFESSLKKGTLAVISGKIAKQSPDAMKLRSPSAILGVRGTEFFVQVSDADN